MIKPVILRCVIKDEIFSTKTAFHHTSVWYNNNRYSYMRSTMILSFVTFLCRYIEIDTIRTSKFHENIAIVYTYWYVGKFQSCTFVSTLNV